MLLLPALGFFLDFAGTPATTGDLYADASPFVVALDIAYLRTLRVCGSRVLLGSSLGSAMSSIGLRYLIYNRWVADPPSTGSCVLNRCVPELTSRRDYEPSRVTLSTTKF